MVNKLIELDGSYEEGGGQILRTALGLSILTQRPFRIKNIRKNRPKPGLQNQHLSCIKICKELSNATVTGNYLESQEVEFVPKVIRNRQLEVNIGTAGSATLLLQSLLLPIMFTECDVRIIGGTDVKWSMPLDYLRNILIPIINNYTNFELICEKRGYYPKGGGLVEVHTKPKFRISDFDDFSKFHQYVFGHPIALFNPGKIMHIRGISHASKDLQQKEVAERQAKSASLILSGLSSARVDNEYSNTESTGSGIMIYSIHRNDNRRNGNNRSNSKYDSSSYRLGSDALGEKGVKAEEVGRLASEKLLEYARAEIVVDEHLQDNIIPLLGLFGGKIKTCRISNHTKSNIYVCEKFLNVEYNIKKCESHKDQELNERNKQSNEKTEVYQEQKNNHNKKNDQIEANFISVLSSSRS